MEQMLQKTTKRLSLSVLTLAGLVAGGSVNQVWAQPPGGGFGPPPEIMAKIKAWQKYNDDHKGISNLQGLFFQVQQMDKEPETALTKPQAAKLLPVLKSWRSKPTMTDDQAKTVQKQMESVLTEKQIKKIATIPIPWKSGRGGGFGGGRPGGGGGFGGGRPGGGGPGGRPPGGFTFPDPPKGGYNPLNPDTLPFEQMRPQAKKGEDDFIASLQTRTK